jgi:hypothetical protein
LVGWLVGWLVTHSIKGLVESQLQVA